MNGDAAPGDWLDGQRATWPEAARGRPVVLPFGAFEQHGLHLPLSTDTTMAAALARAVARGVGAFLLPAIPFGASAGNDGFPGTVSLTSATVTAVARDVAAAVARQGHGALIIVNGDFGNRVPLRYAAAGAALPVLVVDYPGLEEAAGEICESVPAAPGFYHADELETSVMLALDPGSVRMDDAVAEYPAFPNAAAPGPLHLLSRSGVFGDGRPATRAKGEALLERLVAGALAQVRPWLGEL